MEEKLGLDGGITASGFSAEGISDTAERLSVLRGHAARLPLCPGVYIMRGEGGKIIYVGKSRALRNRVSSYFVASFPIETPHDLKTRRMAESVRAFDYIVCKSEIEALTLENNLIKLHSPYYNIKLKDAKSYPYIRVGGGEYPRITVTRQIKNDGAKYFGPYSSASEARDAANTVSKIFALPVCRHVFPRDIGRVRPCLYSQMGKCMAPCTGKVKKSEYDVAVRAASAVLGGHISGACAKLEEEMLRLAEAEEFEAAARCRDGIIALGRLKSKQRAVSASSGEEDYFAIANEGKSSCLAMLSVREGKLVGKAGYLFSSDEIADEEALCGFIGARYDISREVPERIFLGFDLADEERELLSEYLSKFSDRRKVKIITPKRGDHRKLCEMARDNAKEQLRQQAGEQSREELILAKLASVLALEVLPSRIEAFDISNIGSEFITAGMIVFSDARPRKSDYRLFRIKTTDGIDDYGAMREAIARRYSRDGSLSSLPLPDLLLVDGGAGQISSALSALSEVGVEIPVFGMVKDERHRTRALLSPDGEEIGIGADRALYNLIYQIQEEVHRFSIKNMMAAKRKSLGRSSLEDLRGIGPAKAKRLLSHFGSLRAIGEAEIDEIARAGSVSRELAGEIKAKYSKRN